ncbi:shikimate dehydrogenase family protein [Christiangramia forsetii]|uniref:Shikimate 5-dehydrogenase n=2 Tax=Christiangramia forsetii TaxID=411153 RepID=A0LZE8_CHRFK|nr:shikimate dehydrogenase [Christiangramia forsetii]GGG38142.1 shikimate 5-dehydrogenase [Christiangramia forsetii]CAL65743.1 shikimate 5-dehydrogenase [Christiangramia forsetii KT0803]
MRTFGLLGKNIDYSFSRNYFSDKFSNENIDAEYRNFDLSSIEKFTDVIKDNIISGLNVTIPYKEAIIPYLDHLDSNAEKIKAVNTIKFEKDGSLCGYNTDYWGFLESLKPHLEPHHSKALILGTGGASKGIAYALSLLEIDFKFVSRNPEEDQFSYHELDSKIIGSHSLIINCTPLGTYPDIESSPEIPFEFISEKHLIYDLIYNPSETKFMQLAAEKGAKTTNGLEMLKLQAEKAWSIWNS